MPSPRTPVIIQDGLHSSVPPMLPPHLLNVILNKDMVDTVSGKLSFYLDNFVSGCNLAIEYKIGRYCR